MVQPTTEFSCPSKPSCTRGRSAIMQPIVLRKMILALALCCLAAINAASQELTPRAYWPAPKGINVAVLGCVHAQGDVLFDPTIPLYGVDSEVNIAVLGYLRTLSLWGRTSNLVVELPYQWSTNKGILVDTPAEGSVS